MKKIAILLSIIAITSVFEANAFWNRGNSGGYAPWGNNGMFSFNPYSVWNPRWYVEEMDNIMDEFDNNNSYGYNNPYNAYNPYNNRYNPYFGRNTHGWNNNMLNNNFYRNHSVPWNRPAMVPTK